MIGAYLWAVFADALTTIFAWGKRPFLAGLARTGQRQGVVIRQP